MISAEKKQEVFKKFGGDEKNTGSVEGQIALFTERITHISEHLRSNKKDHNSTRSLMKLVGKRRKLLKYLAATDITKYRQLLVDLNIRK